MLLNPQARPWRTSLIFPFMPATTHFWNLSVTQSSSKALAHIFDFSVYASHDPLLEPISNPEHSGRDYFEIGGLLLKLDKFTAKTTNESKQYSIYDYCSCQATQKFVSRKFATKLPLITIFFKSKPGYSICIYCICISGSIAR